MKKYNILFTRLLTLLLLGGAGFLASCGDDDEGPLPTMIQFTDETVTVMESAQSVDVVLDFDRAVQIAGGVDITLGGSAVYGQDYTTTPAATNGTISLPVNLNDDDAVITINPIDNNTFDGDRTVTMTLGNAEGVQLGETTLLTVTITEDDAEPSSIADVRALYSGTQVDVAEDLYIEGVVTSRNEAVTSRNLFIEDETGGIVLRFEEAHTFAQGDRLRVNLSGGNLNEFNDLLQAQALTLANATVLETGVALPTPQVVTLEELSTGNYEGELVTVQDVRFVNADGVEDFSGNQPITDGNTSLIVRTESYAPFASEILPLGAGNITGIAGVYNGDAQVLPQQRSDIFANDPAGTITLSESSLDFGSVQNGAVSASQSYTVTFDGSISEVQVSAPTGYQISLDDADFSVNPLTVTTSGATVYVRFAPATGTNGTIAGEIENSALDAVTKIVAVTGTETGNDPGAATPDLFISEYAEGSSSNKYIELYNPTGAAIDLSNYSIRLASNGGDYSNTLDMTGTLAAGETYVIANASADAAILAVDDVTSNVTFFNGDDAIGLFKSDGAGGFNLIDVIGVQGVDPGSAWDVAGVTGATAEHTLVRKPGIVKGNVNWTVSAGTDAASSEWIVKDQNDWTNIGAHTN